MRAVLDHCAPGVRELELAAHADYVMKKLGAYSYGFDASFAPASHRYDHRKILEQIDWRVRNGNARRESTV